LVDHTTKAVVSNQ